jgi:two-component system response regulator
MRTTIDILLVDDNPNDQELTLRALRKYNANLRVHVVHDGVEALEFMFATGRYAQRQPLMHPRVILLDLKLPKIDGLEVLQRLRADPELRATPVVMLTSSREERDVAESYRLGVNSYIVKPVDYDEFTETMKQVGGYWMQLNQLPVHA